MDIQDEEREAVEGSGSANTDDNKLICQLLFFSIFHLVWSPEKTLAKDKTTKMQR